MDLRGSKSNALNARRDVLDARRLALGALGSPTSRPSSAYSTSRGHAGNVAPSFSSSLVHAAAATATDASAAAAALSPPPARSYRTSSAAAAATSSAVTSAVSEALAEMTAAQERANTLAGACSSLTRLLADIIGTVEGRAPHVFGKEAGDVYCVSFGVGPLGE